MTPPPLRPAALSLGLALLLAAAPGASAVILWSDDFSSDAVGSAPTADFLHDGTQDWGTTPGGTTTGLVNATGNPSKSLEFVDSDTGFSLQMKVVGTQWTPFSAAAPATNTLKVSFDWNTASSVGAGASTQRMVLTLNGSGQTITLGFGDVGGTNAFYAATSTASVAPTPSTSNAIGWNGASFNNGASYGTYSPSGTNTTSGFVHFDLFYVDQASTLTIVETKGTDVSTFSVTGVTPGDFSNSVSNIAFLSGASGTSDTFFDNIVVEAIPEPSSLALTGLGALGLGLLVLRQRRGHAWSL